MSQPEASCSKCGRIRDPFLHTRSELKSVAAKVWLYRTCPLADEAERARRSRSKSLRNWTCPIVYRAGVMFPRLHAAPEASP